MSLRSILALLMLMPAPALAVDAVTGASRREQPAGQEHAVLWIVGRGFAPGLSVSISGDGLTQLRDPEVVPEAERRDGGRGDGINYHFSIDAAATQGARDITVNGGDGTSATGQGLVEIVAPDPNAPQPDVGAPAPSDGGPPDPNRPDGGAQEPQPQGQPGDVDIVTRASPRGAEQGAQVNLWIVGRSFAPGLTVTFSNEALGPADIEGNPIRPEVVRNAESERGMADGIQYFLRVPQDAEPGPVDVTVTNPNGTSATGRRVLQVVRPGERPPPVDGDGDVDGVTGASPRVARAGQNISLWIWGTGFEPGAQVRFASPSIRPYAEPEVVKVSTSHEGFSGVRNFLVVDDDTLPGPVDFEVVNPNGTTAAGQGLFEIVEDAAGGGGAYVEDGGPCPDNLTSIEAVSRVSPVQVERGSSVSLTIEGRAFACGASVRISGGGLSASGQPRLVRDPNDPAATALLWEIEVLEDAEPGSRDVTVINPNNTSKTLEEAFRVATSGQGGTSQKGGAFCSVTPGRSLDPPWAFLILAIARRRRL